MEFDGPPALVTVAIGSAGRGIATGPVDRGADAGVAYRADRASFVTGQVLHVNGGTYPTPTLVSRERS